MDERANNPDDMPMLEGSAVVPSAEVVLRDGTSVSLGKPELEEKLFHAPDDQIASAGQILTGFYQETGTTAQDHAPRRMLAEALANGSATGAATLEAINGDFLFMRGDTLVPFERILFTVEYSISAKRNG